MSEHVNSHPAPGQQVGDHHPENPWSEHKYAQFYRLYNRAALEKNAPLDIDVGWFLPHNWEKFHKDLAASRASDEANAPQITPSTANLLVSSADTVGDVAEYFDPHIQYSVNAASDWEDRVLTYLTDITQLSRSVAKKLSISSLQTASADQLSKYNQEFLEGVNRMSAPKTELSIAPQLFHTISGEKGVREGGWYDADAIPTALRKNWAKNGLVISASRENVGALTTEMVFGKEIANKMNNIWWKGWNGHTKVFRNKFGSKLVGGAYIGLAAWTLWLKWVHINERELWRQKQKFAYRLLDDTAPLTGAQQKVYELHSKWASNLFEEEEEEAAEDEE